MPFCYSPWTNIDISPNGRVAPCCKFVGPVPEYSTAEEYTSSQFLAEIKNDFKNQKWPAGCERCQIEEQNNIKSKRQLDYERWKDHYESYDLDSEKFITASVAFGNTCNLKCITCGPSSSSLWHQEHKQIYGNTVAPVKFFKQNFVKEFVDHAPDIVHLDIPGGEPFLSGVPEQKQLLRHYIQTGHAAGITLHYTTNATLWPDHEWWDLWQHFKEVEIQLSIDGIGARFEYIRYPGNWNKVSDNVVRYVSLQHKIKLSVSHTVSAYNIYYLDEFFSWCHTQGLPRPWLGRVHRPAHMRPSVWPSPARDAIVAHLMSSKHPDVVTWANLINSSDDSNLFELFKQKCYQHDQYRKTNFADVFPEMALYIKQ
jgi:radical SAM protein with 4Fe4S-binding SPASM domain